MSATLTKTPTPTGLPATTFNRILDEGYGPGAWYGSDLHAAVGEVTPVTAFKGRRRRGTTSPKSLCTTPTGRGQIAGKLTGEAAAAFPLDGEDWFELTDESQLPWKEIVATLDAAQQRLSQAVSEIASGARISPLGEAERFDLVVGITGHAAYHAGQIQLIKKLSGA